MYTFTTFVIETLLFFVCVCVFFNIFQDKDHTLVETDCAGAPGNSCTGMAPTGLSTTHVWSYVLAEGPLAVCAGHWDSTVCSVTVLCVSKESDMHYIRFQVTECRGGRSHLVHERASGRKESCGTGSSLKIRTHPVFLILVPWRAPVL